MKLRPLQSPFAQAVATTLVVAGGALLSALLFGVSGSFLLAQEERRTLLVLAIFVVTYGVIAVGKLPGFRLDRAGAALLGASLMIGVGALSLEDAYRAIDFDTIALLLGMMIVVANLTLSGFFSLAAQHIGALARRPITLLTGVVCLSGVFSAFLVNDAICLVMTPLTLGLAQRLKRDPLPYLLAVALSSNIGSTATITGNPQNMIVAGVSHIGYTDFAAALWPVAAEGLILTIVLLALVYRSEFLTAATLPTMPPGPVRINRFLALKSVAVLLAMVAFFAAGQQVAKVALLGGSFLLLTRRIKAERVYREIDWSLLLMFCGLFVVVAGFERNVLAGSLDRWARFDLDSPPLLTATTAILSNLVSNVPAVLLLEPFLAGARDPHRAWLIVAMASTLAGNFTLVGSVANLIVAKGAARANVRIGFWRYFVVGAPLTLMTLAFGLWRLG